MRKIKSLLMIMVVLAMLLSLVACGTTQTTTAATTTATTASALKIAYAQRNATGNWLISQTKDIEKVAKERGINIQITIADDKQAQQLTDVENLLASGIDYLVYPPIEYEAGAAALEKAKAAGVPVILLGNDCKKTEDQYVASLQFDFVEDARVIAQWVADNVDGQINVCEITGIPGSEPALRRSEGLKKVVDANSDRMKIVVSQTANFLLDEAQSVMENILQSKKGEFNVVFCQTDEMALGALAAVKAAGLVPGKDLIIVGIDGQKAAVQAIVDGELAAVSTCDTKNGKILFDTIASLEAGTLPAKHITIPSYIIDSKNAAAELPMAF